MIKSTKKEIHKCTCKNGKARGASECEVVQFWMKESSKHEGIAKGRESAVWAMERELIWFKELVKLAVLDKK